jgi:competence protein ComEC
MMRGLLRIILTLCLATGACDQGVSRVAARGSVATDVPRVVINEVMGNPRAVSDERGEWFELYSLEAAPIDIRGWAIASENDRPMVVERSVVVPPRGFVVLARDGDRGSNGGVAAAYAYGPGVALGNGADWLALRLPDGRTVDSVSWTAATAGASRALLDAGAPHADVAGGAWATSVTAFGLGDRGTPGAANEGAVGPEAAARGGQEPPDASPPVGPAGRGAPRIDSGDPPRDSTLVVRLLDVGQGDAILIENGGSRVLIDGGPDPVRFGRTLERLGLEGSTIDAVIITHQHYDHYAGLRELFRSRRRIGVRYVFENKDPYPNVSLAELRDSIGSRARRGDLDYRDTDDPCGTGAPSCTITMRGGARLHVLRPDPRGDGPNNRSAAVKVVAVDSGAFTMWLAGDAEQQQIRWFDATDYDRTPGMRATVLKADHHGSCDGISRRYLDLVRPEIVALSLAGANDYGYVHSQTLDLLTSRRIPWYRTDQNGTITITAPLRRATGAARGYSVAVERGGPNMRGPSDRPARSCGEIGVRP